MWQEGKCWLFNLAPDFILVLEKICKIVEMISGKPDEFEQSEYASVTNKH